MTDRERKAIKHGYLWAMRFYEIKYDDNEKLLDSINTGLEMAFDSFEFMMERDVLK